MSDDRTPVPSGRPGVGAVDELRDLLGGAAVLEPADGLERYEIPARGPAGTTALVVRPASTDEIRIVVGWARRHLVRLIPQGANTGLVGASTPGPDGGVVLSLERCTGEIRIDAAERTATVGAGTRLSALNEAASAHGLRLPIDLGADPTIGGMVATNTGGARMLRHGDMRRHVLGLHAVTADDTCSVIGTLDGLRKHSTGPSIDHLLVGSGGALGVVSEVKVELAVVDAERACAWLSPTDDRSTILLLGELERTLRDELSAFEVLSSAAAGAAIDLIDARPPIDPIPPSLVLVEAAGGEGVEARLVAALASCDRLGLLVDAVVVPPSDAWELRHAVSEGLRATGVVTGFDLSVPRTRLAELRRAVADEVVAAFPRTQVADFGHWGDGGIHCNVVWPRGAAPSSGELDEVRELVFGIVVGRFAGSYSAEHGIGPHNAEQWRRHTPPAERAMIAAIRSVVDPLGILGHPGLPY